jgi:hypothetical protein
MHLIALGFLLVMPSITNAETKDLMSTPWEFPWPQEKIAHYTAYRAAGPIQIDGHLNEESWKSSPRSPRFSDLIKGAPGIHDTRAAVLWDDQYLYVGYWIEEPCVEAKLTERDAPIYEDNDVEFFIAGKDAYYEFEINAFGTIYEVFFIWKRLTKKPATINCLTLIAPPTRCGPSPVLALKTIRVATA